MKILSISQILNKSWELFKRQAGMLVALIFVYVLTSSVLSFIRQEYFHEYDFTSILFTILYYIISLILSLGLVRIAINVVDEERVDLDLLFSERNGTLLLHYFFGGLFIAIVVIIGFVFLIIPGIYLIFRLQFFQYALLEHEQPDFWVAINESWEMTKGQVWDLFAIAVCCFFIILLGLLAFLIGVFVAYPLVLIIYAVVFRVLNPKTKNHLVIQA